MTAVAIRPNDAAPGALTAATLSAIAEYARTIDTIHGLDDLTAKINAARELVKMQDDVRDIRRMLMHAEVAVLLRRAELDYASLHSWGKKAARAFQKLTDDEIHAYVEANFEEYGSAQKLGVALSREQQEAEEISEGERFAREASYRARLLRTANVERDDDRLERDRAFIEDRQKEVASNLRDIIDAFTCTGDPFTVDDVSEALLATYPYWRYGNPSAFRDGVRRVCREAVRAARVVTFEGDRMPTSIAVESPEGWVRIPLASATPLDIGSAIRERDLQIERDKASRDQLARFRDSIVADGCADDEPIGPFLSEPA